MNDDFGKFSEQEIGELRKLFFSQAQEIVEELQDALLRLEAAPDDVETLKTVKRYVHTLKGDSNSVGLTLLGAFCHRMEDVLSSLVDGTGNPSTRPGTFS